MPTHVKYMFEGRRRRSSSHLVGFEITAVLYLHPFLAEFSPAQVPW